jgi:hypothetical protein
MEAVTIAGIAVVAVGGFYSAVDFLNDLGILVKKPRVEAKVSSFFRRCELPAQKRVKKMAGMHV